MNVKVTNRVYTAKAFPTPELDKITVPNFTTPKGRFTAGVLRCCPGTLLIFPTGSVVINKCKTDEDAVDSIYTCLDQTGFLLSDLRLVNLVGCIKFGKSIDPAVAHENTSGSIFEPEIHCGLLYYIDNVSVIVYHTETIMFAGWKSQEQYDSVVDSICQRYNQ